MEFAYLLKCFTYVANIIYGLKCFTLWNVKFEKALMIWAWFIWSGWFHINGNWLSWFFFAPFFQKEKLWISYLHMTCSNCVQDGGFSYSLCLGLFHHCLKMVLFLVHLIDIFNSKFACKIKALTILSVYEFYSSHTCRCFCCGR